MSYGLSSIAVTCPSDVVCPWSLASAKPAGHTLSSINIFQTWPLYTDSYQIFHCVWMKGCSSAPPPPPYTDSYQIFHCVWMKGCSSAPPPPPTLILIRSSTVSEWRDALVQCFSTQCSAAVLFLYRKKCYTNNLELNVRHRCEWTTMLTFTETVYMGCVFDL